VFLLYGVWVRSTGSRRVRALPSDAAGRTMSAYSTTPSLILTGTLVVLTTALAMARGGFQASALGAVASVAVRTAADRTVRSGSLRSIMSSCGGRLGSQPPSDSGIHGLNDEGGRELVPRECLGRAYAAAPTRPRLSGRFLVLT
jgi:hypothetical protein